MSFVKAFEHKGSACKVYVHENYSSEKYERYNPSDHDNYPASRPVHAVRGEINGKNFKTEKFTDWDKAADVAGQMEATLKAEILGRVLDKKVPAVVTKLHNNGYHKI